MTTLIYKVWVSGKQINLQTYFRISRYDDFSSLGLKSEQIPINLYTAFLLKEINIV